MPAMHVEVNGVRLWFDVNGTKLVPDGPRMRERPTVVLVHGGPASYDHSYFKPDFAPLAREAQLVYVDLRDHGRSERSSPEAWSFEVCADDLHAFCDTVGIQHPIVYGHSAGGCVAMLYGARHPGHAAALILQSTAARFDVTRLVEGFRRFGGDEIAELARRDYGGDAVTEAEWARVFATFGPHVPNAEQLARRIKNPELSARGIELVCGFDMVAQLSRIDCPTLVCVGSRDPVTSVEAAREIVAGLRPGIGRLEVMQGAGHFPWKDQAERYWALLSHFIAEVSR
jgi:proline iminopeptidase